MTWVPTFNKTEMISKHFVIQLTNKLCTRCKSVVAKWYTIY